MNTTLPAPPPPDGQAKAAASNDVTGYWLPANPTSDAYPAANAIAMDGNALDSGTSIVVATTNGVYRSQNGGSNWQEWGEELPGRRATTVLWHNPAFYTVVNGKIFRRLPNTHVWSEFTNGLVATPGISRLAVSPNGTLLASGSLRRVYKYVDAAQQWQDISGALPSLTTNSINALVADSNNIFVATNKAIYISPITNTAWTTDTVVETTSSDFITALALDPAENLYAARSGSSGGVYLVSACPVIKKEALLIQRNSCLYTSATLTTTTITSLAVASSTNFYAGTYSGFYSSYATGTGQALYQSAASGTAVYQIALSPDAFGANATPGSGITFLSTSTGVLRVDVVNGGSLRLNQGLNDLRINLVQRAGSSTLFAATDQILHRSEDSGAQWFTRDGPGSNGVTALAATPSYDADGKLFMTGAKRYIYGDSTLAVSSDRFATWRLGTVPVSAEFLQLSPDFANDHTLVVASHSGGNAIPTAPQLFEPYGVVRSTNEGITWTNVVTGLVGRQLHAFAAATATNQTPRWLAGTDAGVYHLDGNDTWQPFGSPIGDIRSLAYARNGAVFALSSTGLYSYTTTTGDWRALQASGGITTSLPLGDIRMIVPSPAFGDGDATLFAGTSKYGVFMSTDAGQSWFAINRGLPNRDILSLTPSPRYAEDQTIFVGTAGSGIFKYKIPPPAPAWLVLLYMGGDDANPLGLGEPMLRLYDSLNSIRNSDLQLVVLFDGPQPDDSRIAVLAPGSEQLQPPSNPPLSLPGSEFDTGSAATLQNFIRWALDTYPGARHTMLSIIDHGGGWAPDFGTPGQKGIGKISAQAGGWRGMSLDSTSSNSLSTKETGEVLRQALRPDERFDILFFDACLMGMLESAYEVRNYADYYIAGENILWANLRYTHYLSPAVLNAVSQPDQVAQRIVADYNSELPDGATARTLPANQPFAIAAIDTQQLTPLATEVNELAQGLIDHLQTPAVLNAISAAYNDAQKFDYDSSMIIDPTDGYVDLADFAQRLATELRTASLLDLANQADDVAHAVETAVIRHTIKSDEAILDNGTKALWDLSAAHGLSIYLPIGEEDCRPTGGMDDPPDPGQSCRKGTSYGGLRTEKQLFYYSDSQQLAMTNDHGAWADLLNLLQGALDVPARDPNDRPYHSPAPRTTGVVLLPLIAKAPVVAPATSSNLVITAIEVLPTSPVAGQPVEVIVTVKNAGSRDIDQPFWVDLYIDPSEPPKTNQIWPTIAPYGAAWEVGSLGAGDALRLSTRSANAAYSRFETLISSGPHQLYALADSYADDRPSGGIEETHEDDNRYGPQEVVALPPVGRVEVAPAQAIPARPRRQP